ncbi:MAG TPA: hypothetical protein VIW67_19840 [Terriglobales bacterium]|jgi:hypothetical protein
MDVHQIIAAINPDVFCDRAVRREVKRVLREGIRNSNRSAYLWAAAKARPVEAGKISPEELEQENPFRFPGFSSPIEKHTLVYDSFDDSLEAFYFWLLDELAAGEWAVTKLMDNYVAAPGSGLFSEMSRRESRAQQDIMKLLREAHSLAQDILRTAAVSDTQKEEEGSLPSSEPSRSEAERSLLRSKVETLKLYSRWLGPYLRQVRQMGQHAKSKTDWANLFNTAGMEIILQAERPYSVEDDVDAGILPKFVLKTSRRTCKPILLIELKIRAAPERTPGGAYVYRGRIEVVLTSYALNEQEIAVVREEVERDDLIEVIGAVAGNAVGTLSEIVDELEGLIPGPSKGELKREDTNPFTALFAFREAKATSAADTKRDSKNPWPRPIRADSEIEKAIRSQAILEARRWCLDFYERCKRTLKMACC